MDEQPREIPPPRLNADEKATLVAFLNYLRDVLIRKASGLPDEAVRRSGVDSGTSLLGLIKHLAGAEHLWFEWAFLGSDPFPELGLQPTDEDTLDNLLAAYRSAITRANEIIDECDDLARLSVRENCSMRWILLHMIEETARHAGHADILREQADGSIGR